MEVSRRVEIGPDVMFGADRMHELSIFEKSSPAEEPLFPSLFKYVALRIAYHSMYGEPFEADLGRQRSHAGL